MGGIGGVVVVKDNELFLFTALDDLGGTSVELGLDLVDDGEYKGRKQAEYEDIELLCLSRQPDPV